MTIQGSCLCGQIRYEIQGEPGEADYCHCSFCRKAHGSAFGSYLSIKPETFRWLAGEDKFGRYQSSSHSARIFCPNCGSPLVAEIGGEYLGVTLGTVDGDPGVHPSSHMFVKSKAPWHRITDDLTQYEEYPPGIEPPT